MTLATKGMKMTVQVTMRHVAGGHASDLERSPQFAFYSIHRASLTSSHLRRPHPPSPQYIAADMGLRLVQKLRTLIGPHPYT